MTTLDIQMVKQARLVNINKNSVILEIAPNEHVWCTRKVFNQIASADESLPVFIIKRYYMGKDRDWIAIPMTL